MTGQTAKTKKVFDGRYEILSIVGRGACSVVYHARHVSSPATEVALKVLIDQKGKNPSAERLRREALAMVSCRHRYIARLDDFHSVGSLCYLSMEYAPESDLRNFVKRTSGKLATDLAERFLKQSAEGLAFIHRAGIIHRDIKPENILVMNEKEVRITDFGVALLPGEECSIADLQSGVGTMNYMAPEILEGKAADQRSDLYALGVVFYELLSGKNPFAGAPLAKQIDVRKNESFPSLAQIDPSIPQYLSDLILQCMRYEADERFASGDDLLASLLNKKSDNFSREQKTLRQKPTRPKTNDIHKRPKKLQAKPKNAEAEDIFEEFDRLVAEDKAASTTKIEAASESTNVNSAINNEQVQNVLSDNSSPGVSSASTISEVDPFGTSDDIEDIFNDKPIEDLNSKVEQSENKPAKDQNSKEDISHIENLAEQISASPSEDSSFDDDLEEVETKSNISKSTVVKPQGSYKNKALVLVTIIFLIGIFLPGIRNSMFGAVNSGIHSLAFWEKSSIELPIYEAKSLSFPIVPKGVFSGTLEGALPGKSIPLTFISFGENGKIAVLLGIEGWAPVILDQQEIVNAKSPRASKTMRVASNGIILEMTGEIKNGSIVGYFSNLINGTQGQWNVEPAI